MEDSATAEISRSQVKHRPLFLVGIILTYFCVLQVWQWLRHGARLEDSSDTVVTRKLVRSLIAAILKEHGSPSAAMPRFVAATQPNTTGVPRDMLLTAAAMFDDVVTSDEYVDFITTHLYSHFAFNRQHRGSEFLSKL